MKNKFFSKTFSLDWLNNIVDSLTGQRKRKALLRISRLADGSLQRPAKVLHEVPPKGSAHKRKTHRPSNIDRVKTPFAEARSTKRRNIRAGEGFYERRNRIYPVEMMAYRKKLAEAKAA